PAGREFRHGARAACDHRPRSLAYHSGAAAGQRGGASSRPDRRPCSVIAVAPAMLVAVVASVNLDRGLERPVGIRTHAVMQNSVIVSQAYLKEHERSLQVETYFMAGDVAAAKPMFDQDIDRYRQVFTLQALLHKIPVAMMLRSDRSVILKSDFRLPPEVQEPPLPPADRLAQIGDAEAVAGWLGDTSYVGALIK